MEKYSGPFQIPKEDKQGLILAPEHNQYRNILWPHSFVSLAIRFRPCESPSHDMTVGCLLEIAIDCVRSMVGEVPAGLISQSYSPKWP